MRGGQRFGAVGCFCWFVAACGVDQRQVGVETAPNEAGSPGSGGTGPGAAGDRPTPGSANGDVDAENTRRDTAIPFTGPAQTSPADAGQLPDADTQPAPVRGSVCSAGATQPCVSASCSGSATCAEDGSGFGACQCDRPAAGDGLVGLACTGDANCGGGTCLGATGNDFLGTGGPEGGYCSFRCTATSECTPHDPASFCTPLRANGPTYCIRSVCGDAVVSPDEACDNGLNMDAYGFSPAACAPGCVAPPHCGDAVIDLNFGEACDDGVNDGTYGRCTPLCLRGPYCGDSEVSDDEDCDDGNRSNGDGCDLNCRIER